MTSQRFVRNSKTRRRRVATAAIAAVLTVVLAACAQSAPGRTPSTAHYLANEGVMIVRGDTKIAFDPLFGNRYPTYHTLPDDMRAALMAGEPPFEGLDAVLISHHHADHFSPGQVRELLLAHSDLQLIAPRQAADAITRDDDPSELTDRITALTLDNGDAPATVSIGGIHIEALRVPHAGWPERATDVENIVYRVTLDGAVTVVHMGDADTDPAHFSAHAKHWQARRTHMAFPPFWFFLDARGLDVLDRHIAPDHAVGVHLPVDTPDDPAQREPGLRGRDLFIEPGETRTIRTTRSR